MRALAFLIALALASPALAQNVQCRTAPAGTSTANCASEAFVTASRGTLTPGVFASLAGCSSAIEGTSAAVTDSTTATWGATISGAGTLHVLAYCNGINWTVAGN